MNFLNVAFFLDPLNELMRDVCHLFLRVLREF